MDKVSGDQCLCDVCALCIFVDFCVLHGVCFCVGCVLWSVYECGEWFMSEVCAMWIVCGVHGVSLCKVCALCRVCVMNCLNVWGVCAVDSLCVEFCVCVRFVLCGMHV